MISPVTLSALVECTNGALIGTDVECAGVSTDSRKLRPGELFLALRGENLDGHCFLQQARQRGAVAAVVSRAADSPMPLLQVADTHRALGRIANFNRRRSRARVVAVTGSQGKTTAKEMTAAILGNSGPTLSTEANLNNTIGVPLTLLRLQAQHEFAVIEMGADRPGEIAFSSAAASPDIALITNASAAHIEGFGSLAGIVAAKGEIIDSVSDAGTVILNADDPAVDRWSERAGRRKVVLFGVGASTHAPAYSAAGVEVDGKGQVSFTLLTPVGELRSSLKLLGRHSVINAVAAAAAAIEAGANLDAVRAGVASLGPVAGRLAPRPGINGCWLLDDSYNASPSSFAAAIDVLAGLSRRQVLVAGDMQELADESVAAHRYVGDYAARAGLEALLAVGEQSRQTVRAFGARGRHFSDKATLVQACRELARDDVVFLIKGSRAARMETVVNELSSGGKG